MPSDSRTAEKRAADEQIDAAAPSIPVFDLRMEQEDFDAVEAALRSGRWTMGERVEEFEEVFARHLGCRHVVATSSCTTALHMALLTAGIGPGDEVIVPSFTFVATVATVIQAGATPVFAEIGGGHDLCLDPEHAESLIGPRTRAILPVHYGGFAAASDRLEQICAKNDIALLEDAAHAPFSRLGGQALGTFGLAAAFSFFPNKVLGIGEGGALCTDSDEVASRARLLRTPAHGYNYRMDEARAALLLSRFGRMPGEIERRRELVRAYRERLAGVERVSTPFREDQIEESSAYTMSVQLEDAERRDEVRLLLQEKGVQTTLMYPGVHEFSAYQRRFPEVSLPRTEAASRAQINLPLFPHLSEGQVDRVVEALAGAVR